MIGATATLPAAATAVAGARVRRRTLMAAAVFAGIAVLLTVRAAPKLNVPGLPDEAHWVLCDFRDAIYYPAVAFRAGVNPYDPAAYRAAYPVGHTFPAYPPHTLLVHLPFTLAGPTTAAWLNYLATLALTPALAALALALSGLARTPARVLLLASAVLLSRPGHWNLLLGQYSVTVAIGCYLALRYAREAPGRAGVGLALAALKPTYGVPLAVLMLARRNGKAVTRGGVLAALGSAAALAWLAYAGVTPAEILAALPANHAAFAADSNVDPLATPFRVDAEILLARLLARQPGAVFSVSLMLGILALGALAVRRLGNDDARARGLSASLVCLSVLTCTYHQGYDLVLLALPLTFFATTRSAHRRLDRLLFTLLSIPAANYLASGTALAALGLGEGARAAVSSTNAAALVAAFALATGLAFRHPRSQEQHIR